MSSADAPRPWHLVLAPAVPLLALISANLADTSPTAVVAPIAIAVAISLLLWRVVASLTGESRGSGLFASILMLASLSYASAGTVAVRLGDARLVAVLYAVLVLIGVGILRLGRRSAMLTLFANRAFTIAVTLLLFQIARAEWARPSLSSLHAATAPVTPAKHPRPDVFIIVLDGYGRADTLESVFGLDNDLVPQLRHDGFVVMDDARANYPQTAHALASALNLEYLPSILQGGSVQNLTRRDLASRIANNRFFKMFADAGYRTTTYRSEYSLVDPGPRAARRGPVLAPNEFDFAVYESTLLPTLSKALGFVRGALPLALHRRHVQWTLDDLSRSAAEEPDAPVLVYAHVLAPHPPFAFTADGGARPTALPALMTDGDHWHAMAHGTAESYQHGYVDAIKFINARIRDIVRRVQSRTRPAIIYIHGDHGPGSNLHFNDPAASDLTERFGILSALYLPAPLAGEFDAPVTPVNVYREIANRALGINLVRLDDRSYVATWNAPFEFTDVTSQLVRCDAEDDDCHGESADR